MSRSDKLRHAVESTIVRTLFRLPSSWLARLGGHRPGDAIDAKLSFLLRASNSLRLDALAPHSPRLARARTRRSLRLLAGRRRPLAHVEERSVPGPDGPLQARIYEPHGLVRPAPALLYLHGGGFVIGDLDTHDALCSLLAEVASCVVVSLAYRLAPEHKFPAAADDAAAGFRWLAAHAHELGLDPTRLAVGGDSAGGNLSAVVTQAAVREDWPVRPMFQLLIYPAVDMRRQHASHRDFADGYVLTAASIDWFLAHYLRGPQDLTDVRASPLLAPDLRGLPPAYIATAGFDPLRDEGNEYAQRLQAAGVPVQLQCHDSLVHGFVSLTDGIEAAAALRAALHPT